MIGNQTENRSTFFSASGNTENTFTNSIHEFKVIQNIKMILLEKFIYGFRLDSVIEIEKIRKYADDMNIRLTKGNELLKKQILKCGIVIGGKLYCKSDDFIKELCDIINRIFCDGANVIYYEMLFLNESDWMSSHNIVSCEMLKEFLKLYVSGCTFSKKFMMKALKCTEKEAVTSEIIRVWGNRPTMRIETLSECLQYIPLKNIKRVMSGNDMFVNTDKSEYFFIEKLIISDNDVANILKYVEKTCEKQGFVSLKDIPIGDLSEENYEISEDTVRKAVCKKILSSPYHLKGKIISKDFDLGTLSLLNEYLKGKKECSFEEVAEKAKELTGSKNRQYVFVALYDEMIRVDVNRFVASEEVYFDIDKTDNVLSEFIKSDFCAVQDVTTFAMFPECGQNWNHYLLESYCYRYSKKYCLCVKNFNNKNVGIIAKKEVNKIYDEMMADALSKMNVELTETSVAKVLFDAGYIAKQKNYNLTEVLQQAEAIRKGR